MLLYKMKFDARGFFTAGYMQCIQLRFQNQRWAWGQKNTHDQDMGEAGGGQLLPSFHNVSFGFPIVILAYSKIVSYDLFWPFLVHP